MPHASSLADMARLSRSAPAAAASSLATKIAGEFTERECAGLESDAALGGRSGAAAAPDGWMAGTTTAAIASAPAASRMNRVVNLDVIDRSNDRVAINVSFRSGAL